MVIGNPVALTFEGSQWHNECSLGGTTKSGTGEPIDTPLTSEWLSTGTACIIVLRVIDNGKRCSVKA